MKPRQDNLKLIVKARSESFEAAVAAARVAMVDYPDSRTVLTWNKHTKRGFAVQRNKVSVTVTECEDGF